MKHSRNCRRIRNNVPPFCHSDRSVSGVEESTTWQKAPTQGKICYSGRFLGSLPFARNDMYDMFSLCAHCSYNVKRRTAPHPPPAGGPPSPAGKVFLELSRGVPVNKPPQSTVQELPLGEAGSAQPRLMRGRGNVKHYRNCRRIRNNVPPFCHSDRSASGAEESTTWDKEPPQDKTCHLGRFLGSLPFARNDMSGGFRFICTGVIIATPRNGT